MTLKAGGIEIVAFHLVSRLDQIDGHRAAHVAQTDETDIRHDRLLTVSRACVLQLQHSGEQRKAAKVACRQGISHCHCPARRAYERRLAEVDDDIEEARLQNDLGRLELAERDREYLVLELSRAVGLGGRLRSSGFDAERARTAVTRSLRYALGRLATHHESLAHHLERSVRTGTYCAYCPDDAAVVAWQT